MLVCRDLFINLSPLEILVFLNHLSFLVKIVAIVVVILVSVDVSGISALLYIIVVTVPLGNLETVILCIIVVLGFSDLVVLHEIDRVSHRLFLLIAYKRYVVYIVIVMYSILSHSMISLWLIHTPDTFVTGTLITVGPVATA